MDAKERTVTLVRHEWMLPSPTHHTEVSKAVAVAQHKQEELRTRRQTPGDIYIRAEDALVVIGFEAERPSQAVRGPRELTADA